MKNIVILIIGLFVMIVSLFGFIPESFRCKSVAETGIAVPAVITKMPKYMVNHHYYVDFVFEDYVFYKSVGSKFYENHNVGDTVLFIHSPEYPNIFLIPGKPVYKVDVVLALLFALFGLFIIIKRKDFAEKF